MVKAVKRSVEAVTEEMARALLEGDDSYGSYLAFQYYYNLVKSTPLKSAVAYKICSVLEDNIGPFDNFDIEGKKFPNKKPKGKEKLAYPSNSNPGKDQVVKEDWEHVLAYFEWRMKSLGDVPEKTTIFKNIDLLAEVLYLSETDREILTFLHVAQNDEVISELATGIIDKEPGRMVPLLSWFLGKPSEVGAIVEAMKVKAPLISNGIVVTEDLFEAEAHGLDTSVFPMIHGAFQELLPLLNLDAESIAETKLGKPVTATLEVSDFSDLSVEIEKIKTVIKNAVKKGEKGVNILLYGPAGGGKTELAKAIAADLGMDMFAIGENDEDDMPESKPDSAARQRVGELLQAHSFLKDKKGVLLFFDEIEDLLNKGTDSDKKADTHSKIIANRLLENNPVVTIWAGNDPDKFHESFRQRFSCSVYVGYPPVMKRMAIWKRQAEIQGAALPEKDMLTLSRRYQAPARMVANAIRVASLSEDISVQGIEATLRESSRIAYGHVEEIESQGGVSNHFRRSLFNYDVKKHNYVSEIIASGASPRPYSIMMTGAPGSGLKNFGRFLAEKGSMNPFEFDMRQIAAASPMSSPSANIRKVFMIATDNRGLLIISNLDALCENPENPSGKWQRDLSLLFADAVSHHELPVIVSSYVPDLQVPDYMQDVFSLDFKVNTLDQEMCAKAYEEYFGSKAENIEFPQGLVPGDFARASHALKKDLNGGATPGKVQEILNRQVNNRREQSGGIGFTHN